MGDGERDRGEGERRERGERQKIGRAMERVLDPSVIPGLRS